MSSVSSSGHEVGWPVNHCKWEILQVLYRFSLIPLNKQFIGYQLCVEIMQA